MIPGELGRLLVRSLIGVGLVVVLGLLAPATVVHADDCPAYHQAQQAAGQPLGPCPVPGQSTDSGGSDQGLPVGWIVVGAIGVVAVGAAIASYSSNNNKPSFQAAPSPRPAQPAEPAAVPPDLMPKAWKEFQMTQIRQKQADALRLREWEDQLAVSGSDPNPSPQYLDWMDVRSYGEEWQNDMQDPVTPSWLNPTIRDFAVDHLPVVGELTGGVRIILQMAGDVSNIIDAVHSGHAAALNYDPAAHRYFVDQSNVLSTSDTVRKLATDINTNILTSDTAIEAAWHAALLLV